jgi:benzoyl-CoA reductase subunit C
MRSRKTSEISPSFARFEQVLAEPWQASRALAEGGQRVVGLLCPNLPEELPHALGLAPSRISVRPEPPTRSPEVMQTYCCTWVLALLDQALKGELAHLWSVTFACNTCDSFQNLPDIWARSVERPGPEQLYSLHLPVRTDSSAAEQLMVDELAAWQSWLEQRADTRLDPARLVASARLYNTIRAALRRLAELAAQGHLPYAAVQAAAVATQSMDRVEAGDLLQRCLEELERAELPAPDDDRARILVVGGYLDDPRLLRWLDEHEADVVADDTCALWRTFQRAADLDLDDPLGDMARRQLRRSPCPVQLDSARRRSDDLLRRVRQHRAQGVLLLPYKGCEPHCFDNVLLIEALERQEIPHLTLELDPQLGSWGQLTTRLEAFVEMFSTDLAWD